MGIFDKRVSFKPFEYPDVMDFKDAIRQSYWIHSEWNFTSDIHDFHLLPEKEKNVAKNAMLAISQIEISVKKFWGNLGNRFPKAEFDQVGITFAESEVRHADAYSHLLEVLGLNQDFEILLQNPVIQGRVDYLTKYLRGAADNSDQNYMLTLTLFSIFIENVSLFSQFLILKSFNKYKNILKDVDNVVQATLKEEELHALFGVHIINYIKKESPEWFNEDFSNKIKRACKKAYDSEVNIINWIFEDGDLPFLKRETVIEFTKDRFNKSLELLGMEQVFEINTEELEKIKWFHEELKTEVSTDFFYKRPVTYSKKIQSITGEDLF